jgi:DNA-binding transcriptional LysR family regulator
MSFRLGCHSSVSILASSVVYSIVLPLGRGSTIPARLANRCLDMLDLVLVETPLEPVPITEAAHWHPRRDTEPAVVWLRRLLYDVAVSVEDEVSGAA